MNVRRFSHLSGYSVPQDAGEIQFQFGNKSRRKKHCGLFRRLLRCLVFLTALRPKKLPLRGANACCRRLFCRHSIQHEGTPAPSYSPCKIEPSYFKQKAFDKLKPPVGGGFARHLFSRPQIPFHRLRSRMISLVSSSVWLSASGSNPRLTFRFPLPAAPQTNSTTRM